MSESKKQEPINKLEQNKKAQSPSKNNPFYYYTGANPPNDQKAIETKKREQSKQSSYNYSPVSRSRSRDKKYKEKNNSLENSKQYQNKNYQRRDRDRGNNYQPPKKQQAGKEEAYYKTKMCPLFDKGGCQKGTSCNFAHGQKQLRGLPNFKKTRLCIPFKNGECSKNANECKYAHGQNQLRKLAYDYFPQKNHDYNRYQKYQRNDRTDRYDRNDRNDRGDRNERGDRSDRNDRSDRHRQHRGDRDGSRDRYRQRHHQHQHQSRDYGSRNSSTQPPPNYGSYAPNYNSAYMIPPSGGYGGDLYPPSSQPQPIGIPPNTNPSSFSSVPPNMSGTQGSYQHTLYSMGPSYDYNYGYLPHNYPPFNPASV